MVRNWVEGNGLMLGERVWFDAEYILIPLLIGFYFSENILSCVHTRRNLALRFWEVVDGSLV